MYRSFRPFSLVALPIEDLECKKLLRVSTGGHTAISPQKHGNLLLFNVSTPTSRVCLSIRFFHVCNSVVLWVQDFCKVRKAEGAPDGSLSWLG
jgi:hypothetical protein